MNPPPPSSAPTPRRRRSRLWKALLILPALCLLTGLIAYPFFNRTMSEPLGPTMMPIGVVETPVRTAPPDQVTPLAESGQGEVMPAVAQSEPVQLAIAPTPTVPSTPRPTVCNGPEQMLILAVGSDDIGLADVIQVVRADFVTPSISALALPRDLWVLIPNLGEYGVKLEAYFGNPVGPNGEELDPPGDYGRINVAYHYGNFYSLPGGGATIMAQTLYANFGLIVDHYAAGDMGGLAQAIDRVGGIDMDVPKAIPGFEAGPQHMSGEQAVRYARHRSTDSDWFRIERQHAVLRAFRTKLLDPQMAPELPGIAESLVQYTTTDLSRADIAALTCLAAQVE